MKSADIKIGEVYAVAVGRESDALGSDYLVKATVLSDNAVRSAYSPGAFRSHKVRDGFEVEYETHHGEPRKKAVRPHAFKGSWDDHVIARDERLTRKAEVDDARQARRTLLNGHIDVINDQAGTDIPHVDPYTKSFRVVLSAAHLDSIALALT